MVQALSGLITAHNVANPNLAVPLGGFDLNTAGYETEDGEGENEDNENE